MRRAWYFNLDAENELAVRSARTPRRATVARSLALREHLRALLGPSDVVVSESASPALRGFAGRAWCPTPGALAVLGRSGACVPPAPPLAVLRRVNHRRFAADLGPTLPLACYVMTRSELDTALAASSSTPWLLKRPFGFAGRGRLRVQPNGIDEAAERWIEASLATDEGLEVEPYVDRTADFALHGHLSRDKKLTLGEPTAQLCDTRGGWVSSGVAKCGDLDLSEARALFKAAEEVAEALATADYFGPFGVDSFRWRAADGTIHFNPRCEVNARYTMGYAVGMGSSRPDLADDP